jgi:hypothetical protein
MKHMVCITFSFWDLSNALQDLTRRGVKEPDGLNFFVPGSPSRSQYRTEIERIAFLKIEYTIVKILALERR